MSETAVAELSDLAMGAILQVEADGEKILLVRTGDEVHAISATCPHAGAPLAEGVYHNGRIVCPWHKAAFCVRTGAVLDPPALDALQRYDVRIDGGRILLAKPGQAPPAAPASDDPRCFVIAGAGAAGAVAAQTLRENGFTGRVVMLDQANRVPYDRTLLSKYALSGQKGAEKSPLQSQAYYRKHTIERRTAEIVRIDPASRVIFSADGSAIRYDAALLATGAAPIRPDLPGAGLDHVFTLRSRADADAILARAGRSTCVAILGAGFIAMEVAASLRERGLDVTVIARESAPFEKQLGADIGRAFLALHEEHGVSFRMNGDVAGIEAAGVRLGNGEIVPADFVVIGFGVAPVTDYAAMLNRDGQGGIIADAQLRAADALYVAGDIASFPYLGRGPNIRVEHWRVAEQQGRIAALNMLGWAVSYVAVPVFWTIQYMKRLDYVGHAQRWDRIAVHGDFGKRQFLAYYIADGKVVAAAGLDRDRDMAALIELFTLRPDWPAEALGDRPAEMLGRGHDP